MLSHAPIEITSQTIDELNPALFRFARRFVRGREEAEDLVQEVWLNALMGAPSFEHRSSLHGWLNGIMRRRAADRYRKRRNTEPYEEELAFGHSVLLVDALDSAAVAGMITRAMTSLSEMEQTAITLCDVQDFDRDQAAERMGVSRGHLRVLLHRGRQKVVQRLEAQGVRRGN